MVFLIRDYRGWIRSAEKHTAIRRRISARQRLLGSYPYSALQWMHVNRKWHRQLGKLPVSVLPVSYEKLIFDYPTQMRRITDFLGVSPFDQVEPSESASHDMYGSPSMREPGTTDVIRYDYRWMSDSRATGWGPLLWPVQRYSRQVLGELTK